MQVLIDSRGRNIERQGRLELVTPCIAERASTQCSSVESVRRALTLGDPSNFPGNCTQHLRGPVFSDNITVTRGKRANDKHSTWASRVS
jgi:hypothetical protein